MVRVKRGNVARKRRKKILQLAKELNNTISKIEKTMVRPLEMIKK